MSRIEEPFSEETGLMNLFGPGDTFLRHCGHINGLVTVLNNGIHDLDFLLFYQDALGHKPDHIRFIDNLRYPAKMTKGGLNQVTGQIIRLYTLKVIPS